MKYKIFLFFIVLLVGFLGMSSGGRGQENKTEGEVIQAAREGLPEFLENIPAKEIAYYGFQSLEELSQTELGAPFRIYTILPDELEAFGFQSPFGNILRETPNWYVPILVKGKRRALLTVAPMEGRLETVGLSGAGLASELEDFYTRLPEKLQLAGITGDCSLRFVRIFQATSDFMLLQTETEEYIEPFRSAQNSLGLKQEGLKSLLEFIPRLKIRVKNSLRF